MTEEQIKEEVENDKQDSVTNTYKRGDLLKMHTYNDAIRRTVGSYVLYPGDFDSKEKGIAINGRRTSFCKSKKGGKYDTIYSRNTS